jgi:hypothetical protein
LVPTHSKGFIPEIQRSSRKRVSRLVSSYNSFPKIERVSSWVKNGLKMA